MTADPLVLADSSEVSVPPSYYPAVPSSREPSSAEFQEWMARIGEGDEHALELLFRAMYEPLCGFARTYVRSPSTAEDLVEDTFLRVWAQRDRLRIRGSAKNYLYTAVRNAALNHLDRLRTEARYSATLSSAWHTAGASVENDAEERLYFEEVNTRVEQAIESLPVRARQTYKLHYQQHLSYAEIGQIMGVSLKTVENQLARALRLLWAELEDILE